MLTLALTMAQEQREGDRVKRFVDKRMKKAFANDKYHRARRTRRLKTLEERKKRNLNELTKRREKLLHKKEAPNRSNKQQHIKDDSQPIMTANKLRQLP